MVGWLVLKYTTNQPYINWNCMNVGKGEKQSKNCACVIYFVAYFVTFTVKMYVVLKGKYNVGVVGKNVSRIFIQTLFNLTLRPPHTPPPSLSALSRYLSLFKSATPKFMHTRAILMSKCEFLFNNNKHRY